METNKIAKKAFPFLFMISVQQIPVCAGYCL